MEEQSHNSEEYLLKSIDSVRYPIGKQDYTVIWGRNPDELSKLVQQAWRNKWKLHGSVTVSVFVMNNAEGKQQSYALYCQALVYES